LQPKPLACGAQYTADNALTAALAEQRFELVNSLAFLFSLRINNKNIMLERLTNDRWYVVAKDFQHVNQKRDRCHPDVGINAA